MVNHFLEYIFKRYIGSLFIFSVVTLYNRAGILSDEFSTSQIRELFGNEFINDLHQLRRTGRAIIE